MKNNKNIKSAIWAEIIWGGILFICSVIFPKWINLCFILMLIGSIVILCIFYKIITKQVNATMNLVDETIQGFMEECPKESFNINEDSLLGKFQMQIGKLYDILQSYQNREAVLRKQINENISNLVHQVNTPITNIKMYSGFLNQKDLSQEEQQLFLNNIKVQADKLSWLGEGFSKISRLETGIINLHPEIDNVLSAILPAINQVAEKAKEHGNEILLQGQQILTAYFDRKWTEEVFFNLLDNAVKYSKEGSDIIIEMIPYELFIRVDIKSKGIQIKKEEYTKVFQRFYRGAESQSQEGVGLGLYIVRKILEEEKGYIKVISSDTSSTLVKGENVFSVFLLKEFTYN